MKFKELPEYIRGRADQAIEFTKWIEECEGYAESGMRAILHCATERHDSLIRIEVGFDKFREHNIVLETANYWDSNHQPILTATQAGYYPEHGYDFYVFEEDQDVEDVFKFLTTSWLWEKFLQNKHPGETYVTFLERTIEELS